VVKLKTILLTGANGFIATQIARNLLADKEVTILALVRANDPQAAQAKTARGWWDYPELINALRSEERRVGKECDR
jgi:long-chain acyl-CoA synthetase